MRTCAKSKIGFSPNWLGNHNRLQLTRFYSGDHDHYVLLPNHYLCVSLQETRKYPEKINSFYKKELLYLINAKIPELLFAIVLYDDIVEWLPKIFECVRTGDSESLTEIKSCSY